MRQTFRGYYEPTENEFEQLWHDALFVFDTNVLLSLYRYSATARAALLMLVQEIADRVWLPHQVAEEFHRNRLTTISQSRKSFIDAKQEISELGRRLAKDFEPLTGPVRRALETMERFVD